LNAGGNLEDADMEALKSELTKYSA
jgi:hypothetical protein